MRNTNVDKWLAALRGGEYRQGKSALRVNDTYCCLGVACDLYAKETGRGRWERADKAVSFKDAYTFILDADDTHPDAEQRYALPDEVQEWLGLKDDIGNYVDREGEMDHAVSLTDRNDSGRSFEEIADIIEAGPIGLFV